MSAGASDAVRTGGRSETRLGLDAARGSREQGSRGGHAPARDEERALKAVLHRGHEQAELERAKPLELGERAGDLLQRSDPVAQARRVLEAEVAREALQLRAKRRQRVGGLALPPVERPRGEPRSPAALERPVRAGRVGDAPAGSSPAQVHVAVGPGAAGVRGRPQLAQEPQLLERRPRARSRARATRPARARRAPPRRPAAAARS